MDDDSGWHEILVDGWGPLVRAAVCERVEESFSIRRGVLAVTVTSPDDAPADATEQVHDAVVAAIGRETGADLDALGSQSAWATYDDVWAELGRRAEQVDGFEEIAESAVRPVLLALAALPREVVEHAGAVHGDDGRLLLLRRGGRPMLDVEGVFRWLATDADATGSTRDRARDLVRIARSRTP